MCKPPKVNYYNVFHHLLTLSSNLAPLSTSCIGAAEEAVEVFDDYAHGYSSIWGATDLLANNFGLLYNSILNSLLLIYGKPQVLNINFFMIGYEIGNIIYLVFYQA